MSLKSINRTGNLYAGFIGTDLDSGCRHQSWITHGDEKFTKFWL